MSDLPIAGNTDQKFFKAIAILLGQQNELLGQIRDRLPEPSDQPASGSGTVELREPATPPDNSGQEPDAAKRPAPARRRTAPTKARTATKKEATDGSAT